MISLKSKTKKLDEPIKDKAGFLDYLIILIIGIILLYPIIWMFMAAFKSNEEIFGTVALFPNKWLFKNFVEGWKGSAGYTYTRFFANTALMVFPTTILTLISSTLVAYGFARFEFPFKKLLFTILLAMMMLPNTVVIIPRYMLYNRFQWIDSYMPFYAPALLCCNSFFPYMLIQFLRGIPRDLDESAYIDGCGTFKTLIEILLPLMKPALFSAGLFQFLWTYNDYFNSLIFVNSVRKYPISLAVRMSLDSESVVQWGKVMAMACVAVLPLMILFFAAQKYFVEGIATSGMKN
ncbi:MAG: carbohydrate ABC transporter permease [Butyrivibrio sp.]|nr:carbohydrate ABC transporter permease [Butyrivibrio sp.]MBO6242386.1 carbohydrate ABC transporter permease [Butyrivibrio sp.]